MTIISVCGIGIVGNSIVKSLEKKEITVKKYDKYQNYGKIEELTESPIIFLCLPTLYSSEKKEYDKTEIFNICEYLKSVKYNGIVVIKSTVEPGTCRMLKDIYNLNILHNPEFLTAKTAEYDFENQNHIVIGGEKITSKSINYLGNFYKKYWTTADISIATYEESELMKIGINSFYSVKIQFFNELYSLTNTFKNANYNKVVNMMLKNNWISPNHIQVPGTDGKLSYGGMCFPKDTNALYQLMLKKGTPCDVLGGTISERNKMRDD